MTGWPKGEASGCNPDYADSSSAPVSIGECGNGSPAGFEPVSCGGSNPLSPTIPIGQSMNECESGWCALCNPDHPQHAEAEQWMIG